MGPSLTSATGSPSSCARRANRKPEYTASDEPTTSSAPAAREQRPRLGHRRLADGAAEEHDVGLEDAAAARARHDAERGDGVVGQVGVAVGRGRGGAREEARVLGDEALVHVRARLDGAAGEAAHVRERAVQLDDAAAARGVVQAIHVLRDDAVRARPRARAWRARGARRSGRAPEKRTHPTVARAQ